LRRKKSNINCLIIGDGPERKNLEKLTAELDLKRNINFAGFLKDHNDLISQIKSAKVFVLPSIREGFGVVVIEANACGVPVITTNHPRNAAKDFIVQNENGFLFKGTSEDLVENIMNVFSKNNWSNACKKYASQYDWNVITRGLEEYYQKCLVV
jgi:glycosyltransferase involved in cell wall biosynthesis